MVHVLHTIQNSVISSRVPRFSLKGNSGVKMDFFHVKGLIFFGGFRQNTDPLLTPYKINGKMKIKKPRTINGTRLKFINKFSLPETSKMAVALQISDSQLI